VPVVLHALHRAAGGSISDDAQSAVTLAAAIVPQITTLQSMQLPLDIQSSPVSSPAKVGFMIIAPAKPSTVQSSRLRMRILWNSRLSDLPDGFHTTGNHGSAIKKAFLVQCARPALVLANFFSALDHSQSY
jgi:hypothetical protein